MESRDDTIQIYTQDAVAALRFYNLPPGVTVRLISLSENATFIVSAERPLGILRLYLSNAGKMAAIRSELAWIETLRRDGAVSTPAILPTINGDLVATFTTDHANRVCVLFEYVPGCEIAEHSPDTYRMVGQIAAQLHTHSRSWQRPPDFHRRTWNLETILGTGTEWGDWRNGPGLNRDSTALLEQTEQMIRDRLAGYAVEADRGGLVHCDLRAANLMVDPQQQIWVIDFDDCGFSWFLWDLCSTTTFIEHLPEVDDIVDAWLAGYQQVRPLLATDIAVIPDLVMLRRLHIFAWLGSHPQSDLAQSLKGAYCAETCQVALRYRSGEFLRRGQNVKVLRV